MSTKKIPDFSGEQLVELLEITQTGFWDWDLLTGKVVCSPVCETRTVSTYGRVMPAALLSATAKKNRFDLSAAA